VTALAPIIARTPVTQIEDVLARMKDIDAALPATDGVACFNRLYLAVTTNVIAAEQRGTFTSTAFLSALDIAFGNLYFGALATLEEGAPPPRAWAPLFDGRSRTDIAPLQFALAGMNAHINRDLAVGLVQAFTELGIDMIRPSPQATDYDSVNAVLASTEASLAQTYFTPLMESLHRDFDGVDDVVANWSVREARAAAWTNGAALWQLRGQAALSSAFVDALDGIVGFAGRGLLLPTA
jgi:hypothetical protein